MARFPNLDIAQLPQVQNHGARGPTTPNVGGRMSPGAPARGGATAGLAANPSRTGMPPMHMGQPAMGSAPPAPRGGSPAGVPAQPGQAAILSHGRTIAALNHLHGIGHPHPAHHAVMSRAKAGLAAVKGSAPMRRGGFGSLGGAGGAVKTGGGLLSSATPSNIPGASSGSQGGSPVAQAAMTMPGPDDV